MVWDGSPNGGFTTGTPWLPVKPPQAARHVAGQEGTPGSVLEHYRAMLAFRRAEPALRQGRTRFLDLAGPVLGFARGNGEGAVLCVFNLSATSQKVNLTDALAVIDPSLGGKLDGKALRLAPHAAVFLRIGDQT
jgi:alpha-glucosidase